MTDLIARLTEAPASGIVRTYDGVKLVWEISEEERATILHALKVKQAAEDACREMTWAEFIGAKWPALVRAVKGEQP